MFALVSLGPAPGDHSYDLVLAGLTRTQRNKLIT
jgi:hypothetical protein